MNTLIATGNLGRDCEKRTTHNGATLVTFPLGINQGYGDNKTVSWLKCNLWGKMAEGNLPQYLNKGVKVVVQGDFNIERYQDHQGIERQDFICQVRQLELIGQALQNNGQSQGQIKPQSQAKGYIQPPPQPVNGIDDDIPF